MEGDWIREDDTGDACSEELSWREMVPAASVGVTVDHGSERPWVLGVSGSDTGVCAPS